MVKKTMKNTYDLFVIKLERPCCYAAKNPQSWKRISSFKFRFTYDWSPGQEIVHAMYVYWDLFWKLMFYCFKIKYFRFHDDINQFVSKI